MPIVYDYRGKVAPNATGDAQRPDQGYIMQAVLDERFSCFRLGG